MSEETIIKAVKTSYDKDVHRSLLKKIDIDYNINILIEQIESDRWILYDVIINEITIGLFIVKLEKQIDDTTELVILFAVSALQQKIPFIVIAEPLITDIAKQSKCKFMRLHSDSIAMNKLIEKHTQYKIIEYIYRKPI